MSENEGKLLGLAHIGIMCSDVEASEKFYVDTLGFQVQTVQPMGNGGKLVFLNVGTCQLELVSHPGHPARESGPVDHICIEVEDIGPLMERLKAKGVQFETETYNDAKNLLGGVRNVFFRGPDGERLEFFDYMKK